MALAALLGAWAAPPAGACDSTSCSLLTRGGNGLVPRGKLRVDLAFGYTDKPNKLNGTREVESVLRPLVAFASQRILPDFHQDVAGFDRAVQLDVAYGLTPRVNLAVSLPVAIWHAHDVSHGGPPQRFGTVGIGDTLVGARMALGPRGLVGGLSLKLPTGASDVDGEFGGGIQDPALQPGTGALDLVATLQHGFRLGGLDAVAAGSYQATTTSALDYRFGNQAILTLAASRAVAGRVKASVQAKLFHQGRSRYLDGGVPSTGATFVYVVPGLRYTSRRELSLYAYLVLAPYRNVNEAQLGPGVGVSTGISKLF
jgi:hypothetical protein